MGVGGSTQCGKAFFPVRTVAWKSASLHAIPIFTFVSGLFYYWFAVADRYTIFLYNHLEATPFDERTSSRYWMSGFVASGAVIVTYTLANWYLGRIAALFYRRYTPPAWWAVWLICAVPLTASILFITMLLNRPTLPLPLAVMCVVTTLAGLALALSPAPLAAQQPLRLGWLTFTGIGLVPSLLLLRAISPFQGLDNQISSVLFAIGSTLAGVGWLVTLSWLQKRQYRHPLKATELFITSLCLSYLVMPLMHYVVLVPPKFRYISAAANFFTFNPAIQLVCLGVDVCLSKTIARLQKTWT